MANGGSSPGWSYGYVPTAAQWNAAFASKMDYNPSGNIFNVPFAFQGNTTSFGAVFTNWAGLAYVSATAPSSTINMYVANGTVLYLSSNTTANWTLNLTMSSSTTLSGVMQTGQYIDVELWVTNGSTAYYQTAMTIDGSAVTVNWENTTAPTMGNPNATDRYVFRVLRSGVSTFEVVGVVSTDVWQGSVIALAYGGTNASLTAVPGAVAYSTSSAINFTANTTTAGQPLLSGNHTSPTWATLTLPSTAAAGTVFNAGTSNTVSATATPTLGANGGTGGTLTLNGSTSGSVTLSTAAAAGTSTAIQLPATNGAAGDVLRLTSPGVASWSPETFPAAISAGQILGASSSNTVIATYTPTLGANGTAAGTLTFAGLTSGSVTVGVPSAAGSTTFNLPSTNGSSGSLLKSDGSGNAAWTTATFPNTAAAGTVLSAGSSNAVSATATPTLGANGGTAGSITLEGSTTGSVAIGVQSGSLTSNVTFNLPTTNGISNYALSTDGFGNTSWQPVSALPNDIGSASLYIQGIVL